MNLTPGQQAKADQMVAQVMESIGRIMTAIHQNEEQALLLLGRAEQHHGKGTDEDTLVNTAIRLGSAHMN